MAYRWSALSMCVVGAWLTVLSCKGTTETICNAGDDIFCKCQDGSDGTKTCKADGQSFETCVGSDGDDCSHIVDPSTSESASHGSSTSNSSASSGSGGASSLALFSPCTDGSECKTGECQNHYCTLDCGNYMDCVDGDIQGDCVRYQNDTIQICSPYCSLQPDCAQYGPDSACGGASALDNPDIVFSVCGDWGSALKPIALGSACTDTPSCSLGLVGYEEVCIAQKCAKGCLEQSDCPSGKTCPSNGTVASMCQ